MKVNLSYSPETLNLGQIRQFFFSRLTLKFDGWPWKTIGHLFNPTSSFEHHLVAICEFKLELQSGNAQLGSKSTIFFHRVTLQFDVWPWQTIGHLFYTTSSFVYHFKSICEFKLELQSGNAQFGSKSTIFFHVTLQFDVWHWKTIGHLFYVTSSFVHLSIIIGEFKLELQSGNAQFGPNSTIFRAVWPWHLTMTLKNNRAPILCYFKLCASFHSHWWIQTGVTVRKRPIWIKSDDFLSPVTLKFDGWPWKTIGRLF